MKGRRYQLVKYNMKKILIVVVLVLITAGVWRWKNQPTMVVVNEENLKTFTLTQLKEFDGTDESKPIYLAMDGYVYDVTAGKEYYKVGGVYHYLAGKDSTNELNIAGGGIIKTKYKIIGRLVD